MRRALVMLIACAAAIALAWWLADLPGRTTLAVGRLSIDAPTALLLAGLGLFNLLLLALIRAADFALSLPRRLRARNNRRREAEGEAARTAAMVAIAAGDAATARREAARARKLLGDRSEAVLLAAEAERLAGDEAGAAKLFGTLADRPDAALLGLRGLFRQAVAREDWEQAATLARRAEAAYPGGSWLREERETLAARTGDWRQALALTGPAKQARRAGAGPTQAAYAVAAADAEVDADRGLKLAKQALRDHPDFVPAALAHARRLRAAGREDRAQETLARAWARMPMPDIAALALAPLSDPAQRLTTATRLVIGLPNDPESHLLLARLNLDAHLPEEARRHLDRARASGLDQRRLWLLAADLEAADEGDSEAGRLAQRDALRRAADAAPDPTWRCDACGTVLPAWQAACPTCHVPGRIRWGEATRPEAGPTEARRTEAARVA